MKGKVYRNVPLLQGNLAVSTRGGKWGQRNLELIIIALWESQPVNTNYPVEKGVDGAHNGAITDKKHSVEVVAMDDTGNKRDDIVGTTDYLEAITVFKAAKNFLFAVALIGLGLVLICFFVADSRYTSYEGTIAGEMAASEGNLARNIEGLAEIAVSHVEAAAAPAENADANVPRSAAMTQPMESGATAVVAPTKGTQAATGAEAKAPARPFRIKFRWIAWVLRVSNFAAVVTVTLYSLLLIFCLKISLVGRLGGINHVARAFVWSLVAIAFLLPWQKYFGGVLAGAVFTPEELMKACTRVTAYDTLEKVFFYTRFAVLPLLVVLMMLAAQVRSVRWAKATLRRLGVI